MSGPERSRRGRAAGVLGVALALAALIAVVYLFQLAPTPGTPALRRGGTGPAASAPAPPSAAAEPEPPAPVAAGGARAPLPALDASDGLVRELAPGLAAHPRLAEWLGLDDLIRQFVAAVANVAEGKSPARRFASLEPAGSFAVRETDEGVFIDTRSYQRYDGLVDVMAALDVPRAVGAYRELEPLFDRAYAELGYPGEDFDDALIAAARNLLATPVIEGPVAVYYEVLTFEYGDPELVMLDDAQRQLLRAGPDNVRRVQEKLGQLLDALGAR